jgi:hypothetical protein
MKTRGKLGFIIALGFVMILSSGALAATIPPFTMMITDGVDTKVWNSKGIDNKDGTFTYSGLRNDPNWTCSWDIDADPDPYVKGVFSVTNTLGVTNFYTVTFTLPIAPQITPLSLTGGSVVGGVTDNNGNGAKLQTAGANPYYMSVIDGVDFVGLFNGPLSTNAGPYLSASTGSASFGTPIPSLLGPPVYSTIGIRLQFGLSPGDSASFTSVFVVEPIPEPSTIIMGITGVIGLVGFAAARRRKR